MSSKAVFVEPHVITNKFLIREEVGKARGGAAKMTKCAVIDEETVAVRKKRDALKDMTVMLQKPLKKHSLFSQEANISGLEDTEPEATVEDTGEEIVY
uniref:Uncharacterized protein n=1 Tax=Solanum tuberosum TaxID=4113 RepID=M1DM79_SOLTU